jgi:K+-transporting ATPase A subunit
MAVDHTRLLLLTALGDIVLALVLAIVAALLLRRFMARLVERHRTVALRLIEPPEGRMQRLHAYLKARESRQLNDPKAHALAFGAYVCVWFVMILLVLAPITAIAALIV